jgi:hypothetical protein
MIRITAPSNRRPGAADSRLHLLRAEWRLIPDQAFRLMSQVALCIGFFAREAEGDARAKLEV